MEHVDFKKNVFMPEEFRDALGIAGRVTVDVLYAKTVGTRIQLGKRQISSILDHAHSKSLPILAHWFQDKKGIGIHIYGNDLLPLSHWNNTEDRSYV